MNTNMKISFLAGTLIAVTGVHLVASVYQAKKYQILKNDNLNLLVNAMKLLELVDLEDVPEEILYDLEFRRISVLTEEG